jgi:hypothetical protein
MRKYEDIARSGEHIENNYCIDNIDAILQWLITFINNCDASLENNNNNIKNYISLINDFKTR